MINIKRMFKSIKFFSAFFFLCPFLCLGQHSFVLEGKISDRKFASGKKVYYSFYSEEGNVLDSLPVKKRKFSISGNIAGATLLQIGIGKDLGSISKNGETWSFYIGPGKQSLMIRKDLQTAKMVGSDVHNESVKYFSTLHSVDSIISNANTIMRDSTVSASKRSKMILQRNQAIRERQQLRLAFIKANPSSSFAIKVLRDYAGITIKPGVIEPIYNNLDPEIRSSNEGLQFAERIRIAKYTSIGSEAPDFEMEDMNGDNLKLSDFRGKYLLLDFWASWCMPCRTEHPFMRKVYAEYKDKGFEIFAVSLDQAGKKEAWVNAIKKDQITWPQVSDLQFYNNKAAILYGIHAISQNFLLDKDGKIIAKNLRGQALESFLKKIFM
jgi:peroxiredoxin